MRSSALAGLTLLLGLSVTAAAQSANLSSTISPDPYTLCAFHPQSAPCEQLNRQIEKETAPQAQAVRQAWLGYARYLKNPAAALTGQDHIWLQENGISPPVDLSDDDLSGLHYVLADMALKDTADRRNAVNNFISRAREAEIFCGFNTCGPAAEPG